MEDHWQKPKLNVEGQVAFWDAQAMLYESVPMTMDNQPEIDLVLEHCLEISCNEIITLGGATGCRDPKMILQKLFSADHLGPFPKVIFNDLAEKQVKWAREKTLRPFIERGLNILFLPGEIKEVCKIINRNNPRRLIIGVYNCRSFVEASGKEGFLLCGYDQYLMNHGIIGDELLMDWVRYIPKGGIVSCGVRSKTSFFDDPDSRSGVKDALRVVQQSVVRGELKDILGLQVIGRSEDKKGFFLSHWYNPIYFRQMLEEIFSPDLFSMAEEHFAKGMIFTIDPIGYKPNGVVTVLNNVIGNVLPSSQFETLIAIRNLII